MYQCYKIYFFSNRTHRTKTQIFCSSLASKNITSLLDIFLSVILYLKKWRKLNCAYAICQMMCFKSSKYGLKLNVWIYSIHCCIGIISKRVLSHFEKNIILLTYDLVKIKLVHVLFFLLTLDIDFCQWIFRDIDKITLTLNIYIVFFFRWIVSDQIQKVSKIRQYIEFWKIKNLNKITKKVNTYIVIKN